MRKVRIKIEHERTADYTGEPTGEYVGGYISLEDLRDLLLGRGRGVSSLPPLPRRGIEISDIYAVHLSLEPSRERANELLARQSVDAKDAGFRIHALTAEVERLSIEVGRLREENESMTYQLEHPDCEDQPCDECCEETEAETRYAY